MQKERQTQHDQKPGTGDSQPASAAAAAAAPAESPDPSEEEEEDSWCWVFFEPTEWSRRYAAAFFTAEITHCDVHDDGVAYYTIEIRCSRHSWSVSHRFSDFESLSSALSGDLAHQPLVLPDYVIGSIRESESAHGDDVKSSSAATDAALFKLPALPAKTLLRDNSAEFLHERVKSLNRFLCDTLRIPRIAERKPVRDFLALDSARIKHGGASAAPTKPAAPSSAASAASASSM
jgi:hypothetical protein